MKTGFLIINYNDFETTAKLLDNIKNYQILDKIVIVDNKSTDDSYNKLYNKYHSSHISVIQNVSNKGYASGINFGSKYLIDILGDCNIIVSNSDIIVYSELDIKALVNSKPEGCAIIAPIIKEHEGYSRGWKIPSPFKDCILNIAYIHNWLRPKLLFYKEVHYYKKIVEVEAVSGCFFLIDSKSLKQVNYFDENTFLYYEENIISKKMQEIKKKIMINTEVEVFHNHSVTIDKSINHMNKYKELKRSQYYFQKEYNRANIIHQILLKITSKISYYLIYFNRKL